jgi:hypothetical protein
MKTKSAPLGYDEAAQHAARTAAAPGDSRWDTLWAEVHKLQDTRQARDADLVSKRPTRDDA